MTLGDYMQVSIVALIGLSPVISLPVNILVDLAM